jgi:uncharacterized protein YbgA (DUF1722 family)
MLAEAGSNLEALAAEYIARFMRALERRPSPRRHASVMERLVGRLRERLDAHDRQELLQSVRDYAAGTVPMLVPMALLRHHLNRRDRERGFQDPSEQIYLSPHPVDLMLRNPL